MKQVSMRWLGRVLLLAAFCLNGFFINVGAGLAKEEPNWDPARPTQVRIQSPTRCKDRQQTVCPKEQRVHTNVELMHPNSPKPHLPPTQTNLIKRALNAPPVDYEARVNPRLTPERLQHLVDVLLTQINLRNIRDLKNLQQKLNYLEHFVCFNRQNHGGQVDPETARLCQSIFLSSAPH